MKLFSSLATAVLAATTALLSANAQAGPMPTNVAAMKLMVDKSTIEVRWRGGGVGYRGVGYRGGLSYAASATASQPAPSSAARSPAARIMAATAVTPAATATTATRLSRITAMAAIPPTATWPSHITAATAMATSVTPVAALARPMAATSPCTSTAGKATNDAARRRHVRLVGERPWAPGPLQNRAGDLTRNARRWSARRPCSTSATSTNTTSSVRSCHRGNGGESDSDVNANIVLRDNCANRPPGIQSGYACV